MSTANEHNVSCSWRDLRFVDEIQNSEIDLLESLIATLAANCYSGDYRVIDELLDRVERLMSQRFAIISLPCGDSWMPINAGSEIEIQFKCVGFQREIIATGTQCIFIIMTTLPTGILL